jgi:hypothetical protein
MEQRVLGPQWADRRPRVPRARRAPPHPHVFRDSRDDSRDSRDSAMTQPSDSLDPWTDRLRTLSPDISREDASRFVHDLYQRAQTDRDQERSDADYEREE